MFKCPTCYKKIKKYPIKNIGYCKCPRCPGCLCLRKDSKPCSLECNQWFPSFFHENNDQDDGYHKWINGKPINKDLIQIQDEQTMRWENITSSVISYWTGAVLSIGDRSVGPEKMRTASTSSSPQSYRILGEYDHEDDEDDDDYYHYINFWFN